MFASFITISALLAEVYAWPPYPHPSHGPLKDPLVVSTSSGHVHGIVEQSYPDVAQFLGIPYAQPPTGTLRWEPPQSLSQPNAQVEATALPPSCMQYLTDLGNSLYVRDVLQFNLEGLNRTGSVSEDCLTLAVWAPTNATAGRRNQGVLWAGNDGKNAAGLPVLVFFYGGGFTTGGIDVPYQIPTQWVQRTQDHIVVSLNYRLNLFGFPNAPGLSEQNLGLLDQRLAVEWVQQNIAAFGGDPSRMVIWGQSAGSISVDFYNFAWHNDSIVAGLIMDSGTAESPTVSTDFAHTNFTFVADHVGCSGLASDPASQLSCMKSVDAAALENFVANYQENGTTPAIAFTPIPDGQVVFSNYTERALQGLQAKIPAIIGTNAQDGVAFAPYNPNGPNQTIAQLELLTIFFCPTTETIRLRTETGRETFRYLYAGNFSNISPRPWMAAYHSSELPMLMGTHPDFRGPSTPLENATSHAFQDAYVAFASDPTNGLASQDWMPYTVGANDVREFGAGVAVQDTNVRAIEAMCNGAVPAS